MRRTFRLAGGHKIRTATLRNFVLIIAPDKREPYIYDYSDVPEELIATANRNAQMNTHPAKARFLGNTRTGEVTRIDAEHAESHLGNAWPTAVPANDAPFSDGTPAFKTLLQHLVFWASHGRTVELEERNGWLIVVPDGGNSYFFDGDGILGQVR